MTRRWFTLGALAALLPWRKIPVPPPTPIYGLTVDLSVWEPISTYHVIWYDQDGTTGG